MKKYWYTSLFVLLLVISQSALAQKISEKQLYPTSVYELYDYVHISMYGDDLKVSLQRLPMVFSNALFTNIGRRQLNEKGKTVLQELKNIKEMQEGYDFQYCWLPIEKEQTDTSFAWYNKNLTGFGRFTSKLEDGKMRITEIHIDQYIGETEKNLFKKMSCSQTTIGAVVRGKRSGLSEQKYGTAVLAHNDSTKFWSEATYINRSSNGLFEVKYSETEKVFVSRIVPIDIRQGDFAYCQDGTEYKRVAITKVEGSRIKIVGEKIDASVNRARLFFKINSYKKVDSEVSIF